MAALAKALPSTLFYITHKHNVEFILQEGILSQKKMQELQPTSAVYSPYSMFISSLKSLPGQGVGKGKIL
jgi:hypothetical protein